MKHGSALRLLVGACALAFALAGCGKDDKKDGESKDDKADKDGDKKVVDKAGGDDKAGGETADDKATDTAKKDEPAEPEGPVKYCGKEDCPCMPDSIENHYETEIMRQCRLSKEHEVQGYPVQAESDVTFNKEGKLISFYPAADVKLGDYNARAKSYIELRPDGSPKSFYPTEPVEVDGVTCKGGIDLFEGGKLRRCEVGAEVELSGYKAVDGDWVTLDEDGKLHRWEVGDRTVKIGKYECTGYLNYVHPTGELMRCGFTKDVRIQGKKYKADDLVCFGTDGKVAECGDFMFDLGG